MTAPRGVTCPGSSAINSRSSFPARVNDPPAQPAPDICVHPTLTRAPRASLLVAVDGPPALIIEVTSPSTALKRDLNMNSGAGKPLLYAAIGVQEYLVFDPHGEYLGAQVWARRLGPHGYAPWQPAEDGRWHSQALGISFAPQGFLLRVYDHDGVLVPLHQELRDENASLRAQLAALKAALRLQRDKSPPAQPICNLRPSSSRAGVVVSSPRD